MSNKVQDQPFSRDGGLLICITEWNAERAWHHWFPIFRKKCECHTEEEEEKEEEEEEVQEEEEML